MDDVPRMHGVDPEPPHWRPSSYRRTHSEPGEKPQMGAIVTCPANHVFAVSPDAIKPSGDTWAHCRCCSWTGDRLLGWNMSAP